MKSNITKMHGQQHIKIRTVVYSHGSYDSTVNLYETLELQVRIKRNFVFIWTHVVLVAAESLALRLFVAVRTTVNCSRLQDQMANVSSTRMGSCAIFSSLNESKNSIMSAAVPMYTSSSWDSWSLVSSPTKQKVLAAWIYLTVWTFHCNWHTAGGKWLTFRQHPATDDEYQHQELFDDCHPRLRVDLQVVRQQMALQRTLSDRKWGFGDRVLTMAVSSCQWRNKGSQLQHNWKHFTVHYIYIYIYITYGARICQIGIRWMSNM